MVAFPVLVQNADRMMIAADRNEEGVIFTFADGCCGLIPFSDLPEVGRRSNLQQIKLPNPYEAILHTKSGEAVEIPWDFARAYCDQPYRPRVEALASRGRQAIGERVRHLRLDAQMTQDELAAAAGIGRVTLVRVESGEQSPRYETLLALARAMKVEPRELLGRAPG